ncbi:O-antigen ligase family protein [Roseomonas eburnea]|uniref:O-antigen ligase family protein n=2 Tax=Neoroseomonas eburnea TaxID=1346889 RepID=A0A9X9XG42_9PROT|nr:O-antigen ligase family protein [Neoroseomonas eburnea]MBR0682678.1 O-antigen ligase family protein [Neoroseomonas eburnea]
MLKAPGLGAAVGGVAAVLHFAGALKSAPPLAALPFDLTVAAALGLFALLPLLAAGRAWSADARIALPLAACGALWLWLVLAGAWSPSRTILQAKLSDAVLLGPPMLLAGLAVAGEGRALRAGADVALAIGVFVAGAIAWGLATDRVVLGGLPGAQPEQVRVQYQIAGLAIASAAALAAVRAAEARHIAARLAWLALVTLLAAAALLPGGRAALAALVLALAVAPAIALWRRGRRGQALGWPFAVFAGAALMLAAVLGDPPLAAGLRTVERLAEGEVAQSSGRLALWRAAAEQGGAALPWGLGTGGFAIAAGHGERRGLYPHNHPLEALAEGGLPGLLFWVVAFGGGAVAAVTLGARAEGWRAARVAALALPMALSVMVSTDLGNRMAWFALGLALGLGVAADDRDVRALRQAGA